AVDQDHAALLELPGDGARLAQAAAMAVEDVADLRAGAVAVVRQHLHHDRGAAGAVALVDDALDRSGIPALAGAAVDRALDVVLRHRRVAGLLDGQPECRIRVDVAPAVTRGDRDRAGQLREELAALGVGCSLLVLDRGPLRVTGHAFDSRRRSRDGEAPESERGAHPGRPAPCPVADPSASEDSWR